ncbi:MAG: protein kinase [Pseudomonadota bacterium]
MADFKTALSALKRGEIGVESIAKNLDKLLSKKPHMAVEVIDQLKRAVAQDLLAQEHYEQLRTTVMDHMTATAPTADEDVKTIFADDGAEDVKTVLAGDDEEAPTIVTETSAPESEERTIISDETAGGTTPTGGTTGVDFDLTSEPASFPDSGTQTGQTATGFAGPGDGSGATKIAEGETLRDRFYLEKVLGVGGMGSVWLGKDLIKVQAQDKKPEVALKVLNEDFKAHPDSFIALQREASRQQKLAHPNIATVYDFDQTVDGIAFLVMEMMDGEPLNDFIKRRVRPEGGLSFELAFPMVKGLGDALIYAHDRNIVHSDFKPGNCFVLKKDKKEDSINMDTIDELSMKVLDFGIARAVKPQGQAEGETTIFDPGKLGALTPAYASLEMLEGEEPDTRDDIYALACCAYELLTGKHPFNKIPANKARDSGLQPEPIKSLTRKQWKGLARGLAFEREDRSQTTGQFLEEFEGAVSPWKNPFVMVPAAIILLTLAFAFPAYQYIEQQEVNARIEMVESGVASDIESVLAEIDAGNFSATETTEILTPGKAQVITYFDNLARAKIDIEQQRYDFDGANAVLEKAESYSVLSGDSKLVALKDYIDESKNRLFAEQFDKFNSALEEGRLLDNDDTDDSHDAMAVVSQVDPNHPMLQDRRLPGAFAAAMNTAIQSQDWTFANQLGDVGLGLIPGSANLTNLLDKAASEQDRAIISNTILTAVAAIQEAMADGKSLADYLPVRDSIGDLARFDPGNQLLPQLSKKIKPLVNADLARLKAGRNWSQSDLVLGDYGLVLRALGMHDAVAPANEYRLEFNGVIGAVAQELSSAIAAGNLAPPADPNAASLVARLNELSSKSERTLAAGDQLARTYLMQGRAARAEGDFTNATAILDNAKQYARSVSVSSAVARDIETAIADGGLDGAALASTNEERQSSFDALFDETQPLIAELGDDPATYMQAFANLDELSFLSPNDPRLTSLSENLVNAVGKGTDALTGKDEWDSAVDLLNNAVVSFPQVAALAARLPTLSAERETFRIEEQKRLVDESKTLVSDLLQDPIGDRPWRSKVQSAMADIQAFGAPNDPWLDETGEKLAAVYVNRAKMMREEQRFAEGATLLEGAERYAPTLAGLEAERAALTEASAAFEAEQAELERLARIDGLKQVFDTQVKANDVAKAQQTLDQLKEALAGNPDQFVETQAPKLLAGAYYRLATTRAGQNRFADALKLAEAAVRLDRKREYELAVREYRTSGNVVIVGDVFSKAGQFDLADVLERMEDTLVLDPAAFPETSMQDWGNKVDQRFQELSEGGQEITALIDQAEELFGRKFGPYAGRATVDARPCSEIPVCSDLEAAVQAGRLSAAKDLLGQAKRDGLDQHSGVVKQLAIYRGEVKKTKALYEQWKNEYKQGQFEQALTTIQQAGGIWTDSEVFKRAQARTEAKLNVETTVSDDGGVLPPPPPTNAPCDASLASYGKRKKGVCYYFVARAQPTPLMVVVPAGEGFSKPFAISKFETTVGDYNRYCKLSKECGEIDKDPKLPVSNVSLSDAQKFSAWLTDRVNSVYPEYGYKFRLPTAEEWQYAADSGGSQPTKDYNCRVTQGEQVIKGQALMPRNAGKSNSWGLYNYVGNVQEWVSKGGEYVVRGGSYTDPFSKCDIGLEKAHSGTPDEATGFRVVLELGNGG